MTPGYVIGRHFVVVLRSFARSNDGDIVESVYLEGFSEYGEFS